MFSQKMMTTQRQSKHDFCARKAARRLLQDNLALSVQGVIPKRPVTWLEEAIGHKPKLKTDMILQCFWLSILATG